MHLLLRKFNRLLLRIYLLVFSFKKYCKFLVENDIEGDVPHLKFTFPEFVARLMTDQNAVPYTEFVEGFKEFHEAENYMFARTLAEFVILFPCFFIY